MEKNASTDNFEKINTRINELQNKLNILKEKEWNGVKILVSMMHKLLDESPYPVVIATELFNKIKYLTDKDDPWRDLKAMSNLVCLNVDQDIKEFIFSIDDEKERLRAAVIFSAIANTIDFGTAMHKVEMNINSEYLMAEYEKFKSKGFTIDDFDLLYSSLVELRESAEATIESDEIAVGELDRVSDEEFEEIESVEPAGDYIENLNEKYDEVPVKTEVKKSDINILEELPGNPVLILLDNSGEIVFDKILIEVLVNMNIPVVAAVKGEPISNDATFEDAEEIDLTEICPVITTGSYDLGFNPHHASREFLELLSVAPVIIAKGQANFEAINTFREYVVNPEIFLIAKFKCDVNSEIAGVKTGEYVLWKMQ